MMNDMNALTAYVDMMNAIVKDAMDNDLISSTLFKELIDVTRKLEDTLEDNED